MIRACGECPRKKAAYYFVLRDSFSPCTLANVATRSCWMRATVYSHRIGGGVVLPAQVEVLSSSSMHEARIVAKT